MQIHEITLREGWGDFFKGLGGTLARGPIGQQLGLHDPRVRRVWDQLYQGIVDKINKDPKTANLPPEQKQAEVEKLALEYSKKVPPTPSDPIKTSQALQQLLRAPEFHTPPRAGAQATPGPQPQSQAQPGTQVAPRRPAPAQPDVEELVQGPDGRWYPKSTVPKPEPLAAPPRALPAPAAPAAPQAPAAPAAPQAPAAPAAPKVTTGGPTPAEYAKLQQRISQATGQPIPKRGFRVGKKR